MLKYPSLAPEVKCDIVCNDKSADKVYSIILRILRSYRKEFNISIPITITESHIIRPECNMVFTAYTISTKADAQKYITPHSIDEYTSTAKDMMIEVIKELSSSNVEVTITKCITEKYVNKQNEEGCNKE